MSNCNEKKNYPNLEKCIVVVSPRASSTSSIATIPTEKINPAWIAAAEAPLPALYNFHAGTCKYIHGRIYTHSWIQISLKPSYYSITIIGLLYFTEKKILQREIKDYLVDAVHHSTTTIGEVNAEDKKRLKMEQLKNITHATESVCLTILQKHDFDLDASIEDYFQHYNNNPQDLTNKLITERRKDLSPNEMDKLIQLMNITQAPESVCETILRKQDFDLNASIDAFYRGES